MPKPNKQPKAPAASKQRKQPRDEIKDSPRKEPRTAERTETIRPLWSFKYIDVGGPWCFGVMSGETLRTVLQRLKGFESLTWSELRSQGSHDVELFNLIKEAQERLIELKQEEIDALYSLRVSNKERIWAIKQGHILRLLWWDPEHQIYPYQLKHT
ncbi:MAG: hypothetical protein M3Y56_05780 [Armatimonadota bacterium]|nr:hypothetical protein [Armatimonadota bacterium]